MANYHAQELLEVAPIGVEKSPYKIQVKFTSEHGQTRWMSVDDATFALIEACLIEMED